MRSAAVVVDLHINHRTIRVGKWGKPLFLPVRHVCACAQVECVVLVRTRVRVCMFYNSY